MGHNNKMERHFMTSIRAHLKSIAFTLWVDYSLINQMRNSPNTHMHSLMSEESPPSPPPIFIVLWHNHSLSLSFFSSLFPLSHTLTTHTRTLSPSHSSLLLSSPSLTNTHSPNSPHTHTHKHTLSLTTHTLYSSLHLSLTLSLSLSLSHTTHTFLLSPSLTFSLSHHTHFPPLSISLSLTPHTLSFSLQYSIYF